MGTLTKDANNLYNYEEIKPNVYQQVANQQGTIEIQNATTKHVKTLNKGDRGGYLKLSDNDVIRAKQIRDINLVNSGTLKHNSWLSYDSTLQGDFKLPINSIIEHSKISAKSDHALLIDDSFLNKTNVVIEPGTSASIIASELKNTDIVTNNSNMHKGQVFFINESRLHDVKCEAQDSSQIIMDSELHNTQLRGNCDIGTSYVSADEQAKLSNMSVQHTHVGLHKATLIASDSDLNNQELSDETAVHNYLIIKNNQIRGKQFKNNKTKESTNDLDL